VKSFNRISFVSQLSNEIKVIRKRGANHLVQLHFSHTHEQARLKVERGEDEYQIDNTRLRFLFN
jgi:hypothetical protein